MSESRKMKFEGYFRHVDKKRGERMSKKYRYIHIIKNGFTGEEQTYQSNFEWDMIPDSENVKLFSQFISTIDIYGDKNETR